MWTFGFTTQGDDSSIDAALATAISDYTAEQTAQGNAPTADDVEQFNSAGAAAKAMVASGAVGDVADYYNVVLTGNSNPGHVYTGALRDMVVVQVTYTT